MLTVTVSQLNRYVKAVLEEDAKLSDLYVKGEVSGFSCNANSGHCYFSLKDETGGIRAVMFARFASLLEFVPHNGMQVLARASVTLYERDGQYQLNVTDLQPHGAGAMAVALEQRKKKLAALGAFDESRKKALPTLPLRIGVVTSPNAAALQDVRTVLERRYPLGTLVLAPALVQGAQAAQSLCTALERLDREGKCDVILLARGGGSAEDLACFNDEALVLAVAACATPVVSAVGHETDVTLCDLAADLRAPTPSAAAELVAPDREQLADRCADAGERLWQSAHRNLDAQWQRLDRARIHPALRSPMRSLERAQERLDRIKVHPVFRNPQRSLERARERLDICSNALYNKKCIFIQTLADKLGSRAAVLDSLSPLRVLDRGYALTYKGDDLAVSAAQLQSGDNIRIRLRDGHVDATVTEVERNDI